MILILGDHTFDTYVAIPLAEFAKSHSSRERIWIVEMDKGIVGSVAVVKYSDIEAQASLAAFRPRGEGPGTWAEALERGFGFL